MFVCFSSGLHSALAAARAPLAAAGASLVSVRGLFGCRASLVGLGLRLELGLGLGLGPSELFKALSGEEFKLPWAYRRLVAAKLIVAAVDASLSTQKEYACARGL